ncbi:hypothetical protein ASD24_11505 [Paenibacillus sp. Root52]|uniref:histidine kinase n=2 Tax=Paenibacillus TaxID=44249 RepID=A0AAP5H5K2_PAEAM|nr:HAMP domain-containing sensor histidine kinase [Paenibacillus amylolyticus]KQY84369.1 hypothetical protein ASD24_11505 [Paenibacillus sp. Root52]MDR6726759.1 signal transduction histidine kinase [Paenibacillus amylolyticus]
MEFMSLTNVIIVVLALIVLYQFRYIYRLRSNLSEIMLVLEDIIRGNTNRRIILSHHDISTQVCYKINEIVKMNNEKLAGFKKAEQSNKLLMTSLSHDVRTPLTSLLGYLEAIDKGIVAGEEKDQYIQTARAKAQDLKEYIDILFEWFKLDAKEQTFHFEYLDIYEVTRDIVAGWIAIFDKHQFQYSISIPSNELYLFLDKNAYKRIINNLLQNAITHSGGSLIELIMDYRNDQVKIKIRDNGRGIADKDLPYVFDRLYVCDPSRKSKSSGLGLSIVRELVKAHNGKIYVESQSAQSTQFIVMMPVRTDMETNAR